LKKEQHCRLILYNRFFKLKNYIKYKLYIILKSWLKIIENENVVSENSKCTIHNSVIKTATTINGTLSVNENSVLERCKLLGQVSIGHNVKVSNAIISGQVILGNYSKIIDGVELHGNIEIGKNTTINGPNTDLRCMLNKITIGNFCSIARNVTFQEYNHNHQKLTMYMVRKNLEGKPFKEDVISKGPIVVEHDVWIGTHCVVLSGVKIGTGAIVAANSVVSANVPPYAIVAGSPAKIIKYRFSENTISSLLQSQWWTKPHTEIIALFNNFKP